MLCDFMPSGETKNAEICCKILKKLQCTIQNQWYVLLSSGVVLLHDNAHPHTTKWEDFKPPLYSADLAQSDSPFSRFEGIFG